MYELERWLAEIAGLGRATLQPAAGAHGEFTGLLIMRAYHESRGRAPKKIIIPDTAHGTNPASVVMAGYQPLAVKSDERGGIDLEALRAVLDTDVAGLMLTNPNTLGLFDEHIVEIAELVHGVGGLLYYDGANANAIMGISRPGDMGFDVVHFNTHKTFSTPHGGGGPGAGPVVVREELAPFLPVPLVERAADGTFWFDYDRPRASARCAASTGTSASWCAPTPTSARWAARGCARSARRAVLNANYVLAGTKDSSTCPTTGAACTSSSCRATPLKAHGVRAMDVAKRLLDYDLHPPTTYFPLLVDEALMIEPTETESREDLDDLRRRADGHRRRGAHGA